MRATRQGGICFCLALVSLLSMELALGHPRGGQQDPPQERAFFGLGLERPGQGQKGVLVFALYPGGPAELAGVKQGDILVEIEGKSVDVKSDLDVLGLFESYEIGSLVHTVFFRDGERLEFDLLGTPVPREIQMQHERVRAGATDVPDGIKELWNVLSAGSRFELRKKGNQQFKLTIKDSNLERVGEIEASAALVEAIRRVQPVGEAMENMTVGEILHFSMTLDHNHRISAHIEESKPPGSDGN